MVDNVVEFGGESAHVGAPEGAARRHDGGSPLVGRMAELAVLDSVIERLGHGAPPVVDITGAAGIGKSRLMAEFCRRARRRGVTVLRGRAAEYERHLPFHPFADAFADLVERPPHDESHLDAVPRILGGRGDGSVPAATDRFGLHRSVAGLLAQLGRAGGLVVALDDVHWADPASLEFLDHLVRHPVSGPVVLVVARRDRQTPTALSAVLAREADTGAVLRIGLAPLAEQDCVEGLAPDLPRARAAQLYAAGEGNPLYFLSLLHAHREDAARRRASSSSRASVFPFTSGPASASVENGIGELPSGLGALLLNELDPLSPSQRGTLEAIAVLGDHAVLPVIGRATGRTDAELDDDLTNLERRDLVRRAAGGRMVLRHPVIRALVHESTAARRRVEIHRAAATELARTGAPAVEQARHVERSVPTWDPQAYAVLRQAAEETASSAPTSCAHWLRAALRILPDTVERGAERRVLMLRRARALGVAGGLQESRDLLHAVISTAGPDEADVRTSAVVLCALTERHLGRYPEAIALLRRELSRQPVPSPAQRVSIGLELSSSAPHNTPYPQMRDHVAQTLADARAVGNEPGEAGALAVAAFGEAYEGGMARASTYAAQAAGLLDGLPDDDLTALCEPLGRLGWAEAFLGRFTDAERHADRGLGIARRTGQVYLLPLLLLCKAHVRIQTCRLPSACELADEAEDIARGIGSGELLAFVLANKAQVRIAASAPGDQEALGAAEEAVASMGPSDNWRASMAWCMLGYAALTGGDPHRARDALLRAGGDDLRGLQPSMRPLLSELLVTAALATGDVDAATAWAERAHDEAERLGLPVQRASAMRSAAQLALHGGAPARAATLLAEAAAECARAGAVFWEARSLLLAAPAMTAAGLEARGAAMWEQGRRLAAGGGAGLLLGLAEMTQPPVPVAPPSTVPPWLASLTVREREVAELVAEGLTNQAIATRLYLSPRTVETHLSRVFRKTNVATRAGLAALMARS
ncbi:LuxR family transcriptional regulator [Streptomyces sp. RTGN2]|uniref:helix-turn-helix transcriptional regulator n=1 Tax=Streptomyces sp. RTGN2 TaxID=3016525 RepID=UPI0025553305|nr:LuxR family transcriptional regulator [Streptomyces sp. RTGN2]